MKKKPKVTIVIPVYNGSRYMKEAIDSALAQTYKNIEIIVVNDGSNDQGKTDRIARSYGNKIKYYKKDNGGVSTALNLAISKMSGEYFSWLSHDDVYYDNKIEKQMEHIVANNYGNKNIILYCDYDLIDYKSRLISQSKKNHELLMEKPEYALLRGNINGITLLIPKKVFDEYGLFDEELFCVQDYEMWRLVMGTYKFEHMPLILAKSRQHRNQATVKNPKVLLEGNKLWINITNSISKKDMERLEGNVYNYYKQMSMFFHDTPYIEARDFCEKKCSELEKEITKNINEIKVSVVVPFYNRINLLIKAIESVINQTHKNIEVILINDGTTDDLNLLKKFIKNDPRIKLINININKGASNARNIGIEAATGKYLAFLDSDDLYRKNKIKKQLYQMMLFNSNVSHTSYLRKGFNKEVVIDSGKLNGRVIPKIIYNCPIATPTVMIKKELLNIKRYRFNVKLSIGEDTCFWLELLRHNEILGINEDLTIVNVSESSSAYNLQKQIIGLKTILTFILNDEEYNQYDFEIALLCSAYIDNVYKLKSDSVKGEKIVCSNCIELIRNKLLKLLAILRLFLKGINSIKTYGLGLTFKNLKNKITKQKKIY